jgi:hypothetical protein
LAHNADALTAFDKQAEAAEHLVPVGIPERYVLEDPSVAASTTSPVVAEPRCQSSIAQASRPTVKMMVTTA